MLKLIKIGAEWCGPCKTMDGVLNKIAETEDIKDKCTIERLDIDTETPELNGYIEEYHITNIPVTILENENGVCLEKWVGAVPYNKMVEKIKECM